MSYIVPCPCYIVEDIHMIKKSKRKKKTFENKIQSQFIKNFSQTNYYFLRLLKKFVLFLRGEQVAMVLGHILT